MLIQGRSQDFLSGGGGLNFQEANFSKAIVRGRARTRGSGGRKSPSGVQGQSPGRGSGGRSPPEARAFL